MNDRRTLLVVHKDDISNAKAFTSSDLDKNVLSNIVIKKLYVPFIILQDISGKVGFRICNENKEIQTCTCTHSYYDTSVSTKSLDCIFIDYYKRTYIDNASKGILRYFGMDRFMSSNGYQNNWNNFTKFAIGTPSGTSDFSPMYIKDMQNYYFVVDPDVLFNNTGLYMYIHDFRFNGYSSISGSYTSQAIAETIILNLLYLPA